MKKICIFLCFVIYAHSSYSQMHYVREWGTMVEPMLLGSNFVAEVNPINGKLYYAVGPVIFEFSQANSQKRSVYVFPPSPGGTIIENIKFDSEGNIIFSGRTLGKAPVTPGTFSQTPLTCGDTGATFIAKLDTNGTIIWCTYFYCLSQNTNHLAIDKLDNIYFLNKRDKNTLLPSNSFQPTGDKSSTINLQDVISKLNSNGQHLWSTFYSKDQSRIKSIVAGNDGLYVYGDHLASTSNSNYFGTTGAYQQYATGVFTGTGGNEKNVFLSKFNFSGNRLWSTYFAVDRSMVPYSETLKYLGGLEVIGDDAYILTKQEIRPVMTKNPTTAGAFLTTQVSMSQYDITLTRFNGNGARLWTSFLYGGDAIYKYFDTDELFISATILNDNTYMSNLTTNNGYQTKFGGGFSDNYFFSLTADGSKMNYGSLYGFAGNDYGINLPTSKGFYSLGYSMVNYNSNSPFASNGEPLNQFTQDRHNRNYYAGTYVAYFELKSLGINDNEYFNTDFNIYPNPASDVLNIQSKESLPENTAFVVYDIAGKKVLTQPAKALDLNQLNVSKITPGVYILQISGKDFNQSFKFIKK